ncbi:MAG: hypothetical protein IPK27_03235 [Rhodanobacteraceae bacterium]|nr:hypothetical protein [Rhodanobacteraceae bacterium]
MNLNLFPEFIRIGLLSPIEAEAVRQKIRDEWLPVYLDADGMSASPCNFSDGTAPSRSYVLSGFWAVLNDPIPEFQDGGLMDLLRLPDIAKLIGFVGKNPPWPEIPGSALMTLDHPCRLTLADLFIRPRDLLVEAPRDNPHAAKREQCLRAAVSLLADPGAHDLRAKSSDKVQANKLRQAIEKEAGRFWKSGTVPLAAKTLEELLSAAIKGKIPE